MNDKTEKILEENGFIVECLSPFEIYHEKTQSRANGYCATMIVEYLLLPVIEE